MILEKNSASMSGLIYKTNCPVIRTTFSLQAHEYSLGKLGLPPLVAQELLEKP